MKIIIVFFSFLFLLLTALLIIKYGYIEKQIKPITKKINYVYKEVSIIKVPKIKGRRVSLNWEKVKNASFYLVYSGKNLKGDFLEQGRTKQNKFDFTTSNKSYFFKVKAAIIDTTK